MKPTAAPDAPADPGVTPAWSGPGLSPLTEHDLPQVMAIEMPSYSHPWSERNFRDSIQSGYWCTKLQIGPQLLAYMIVMQGVDEAHLLNITTAAPLRGQGIGRWLLQCLCNWARLNNLHWVWLEVRASNLAAQSLYHRFGFEQVGRRANYYPAGAAAGLAASREDALVMSYRLD